MDKTPTSEFIFNLTMDNTPTSDFLFNLTMDNTLMNLFEGELTKPWNYKLEFILLLIICIFSIPANLFVLLFSIWKVRRYKHLFDLNPNKTHIANSFYTYLIEISSFDTTLLVYLILDTSFKFLTNMGYSQYESVYDISNFTCKFFIYVVRISSAMSNYLVCLLALNRCMLTLTSLQEVRICFNTKYLTLFLFCVFTIANVFRLEQLSLYSRNKQASKQSQKNSQISVMLEKYLGKVDPIKLKPKFTCGPNIQQVMKSNDTNNSLFWIIFLYNLIFTILPLVLSLLLSCYMIQKRNRMKRNLDKLIHIFKHIKYDEEIGGTGNENPGDSLDQIKNNQTTKLCDITDYRVRVIDLNHSQSYTWLINLFQNNVNSNNNKNNKPRASIRSKQRKEIQILNLNEFHTEFLKTCSPCIVFCLVHVVTTLPYSMIEFTNQFWPNMMLVNVMQYMTYTRYLFYGSKFYILFVVSPKFRKQARRFLGTSIQFYKLPKRDNHFSI